jgi:hypothetical protein
MMKQIACMILYIIVIPLVSLTTNGDSNTFILDTQNPEVTLLAPIGGEEWFSGTYNNILWYATDSNLASTPIELYYSPDEGIHWQVITNPTENSGTYYWMIPSLSSNQMKIKIMITDSYGNIGQDFSDGLFSIIGLSPSPPKNVDIKIVNITDILIHWDDVTTDIYGNPFKPDGYIVLYGNSTIDVGKFVILDIVDKNEYLHENVLGLFPNIFYSIVAYKDYKNRITNFVNNRNQSSKSMNWMQFRQLMQPTR